MSVNGSRIGTIRLVGGRPAIDLVNTVSWRGDPDRTEDHLRDPADCLTWIGRVELLGSAELGTLDRRCRSEPGDARILFDTLRDVRASIARDLVDPPEPDLDRLTVLIRGTLEHCRLTTRERMARWTPPDDVRRPARLVVLDLLDWLTGPNGRLDTCDDPDCGWAFIDTSRQRNRRWCSSTDCGNRDRVRRHYQRVGQ